MERYILYDSPKVIDNSNLIDCIHQLYIEIENEFSKEDKITIFFNEIISYLDQDLAISTFCELSSLILTCFSHYSLQLFPLFNNYYENATKNSYRIINTASILSYITQNCPNLSIDNNYKDFIKNSLEQIQPQIAENDGKGLKIFNQNILPPFQTDLILDLLLSSPLTKELASNFSSFLFTHDLLQNNRKLDLLIYNISKSNFLIEIPENITSKIDFSLESIVKYLPYLSEESFKNLFSKIEEAIEKSDFLNEIFSIIFIEKCNEFNMSTRNIKKLSSAISVSNLTPSLHSYLQSHKNGTSDQISSQNNEFTDIKNISEDALNQLLLKSNNLYFYLKAFSSIKAFYPVLSSSELWSHLVFLASSLDEDLSSDDMRKFRFYFDFFYSKENIKSILKEVALSESHQTPTGIHFVKELIKKPKKRKSSEIDIFLEKSLDEIIEDKIIPSSTFWQIFSKNSICNRLAVKPIPILMYAVEFASGEQDLEFAKVSILKQSEKSKEDLCEYLENYATYELKKNISDEAISLIASAFIFASNEGKIEVEGLTAETVLPFLAVAFDYSNKLFTEKDERNKVLANLIDYFKIDKRYIIVKEACKSLKDNNSPLILKSIDTILPYLYPLCVDQSYALNFTLLILEVLFPLLLNNSYLANKMILLSTLFQISFGGHELNSNEYDGDLLMIKLLFNNKEIALFEFILRNLNNIINDEIIRHHKINSMVFNDDVYNLVIKNIQNYSSSNELINLIRFIEEFCADFPFLKFEDSHILDKVLDEKINEQNTNEVSLIYDFMIKNGLDDDLHYLLDPFVISSIKTEMNEIISKNLFKKLMKSKSISINYIILLLHKINTSDQKNYLDVELISSFCSQEFQNDFVNAAKYLYVKNQLNKELIFKPKINICESNSSIICDLLNTVLDDPCQFNVFMLLKSIASSFPFLFINSSDQVFNAAFLAFDFYEFYLEQTDEIKAKSAISSLSFLASLLCLPLFLDNFILRFFNGIKTLSGSQVLSCMIVFKMLYSVDSIRIPLTSQMIKYDFLNVVNEIISKDLPNGSFRSNYLKNVYSLTEQFYKSLLDSSLENSIFIDELAKISNPFQVVFDNSFPMFFLNFKLSHFIDKNDFIPEFFDQIDTEMSFWVSIYTKKGTKTINNGSFINNFLSLIESRTVVNLEMPGKLNERMLRYIASKPSWIYECIQKPENFKFVSEHEEILSQIINDLNAMNDNESNENANGEFCVITKHYEERILFNLFNQALSLFENHIFDSIPNIITESSVPFLLNSLSQYLKCSSSPSKSSEVSIYFLNQISNRLEIKYNFIEICGDSLLSSIITPECRVRSDLLLKTASLFDPFEEVKLQRIVHLINFMFLVKDTEVTFSAIRLFFKLDKSMQDYLMPFISKLFDRTLNFENKMAESIPLFLHHFPSLVKARTDKLLKMLDQLLLTCGQEKILSQVNEDDNKRNIELIALIFDALAPKRSQFITVESISSSENLIPLGISQTSPDFWKIYSKHKFTLMQILHRNPLLLEKEFKFLLDYPEVVDFSVRFAYFSKTKPKINKEEFIQFTTSSKNILKDSINEMSQLSDVEFLNDLKIQNKTNGQEISKSDFYKMLVSELLHPKNYFFVYTLSKKYLQINPKSAANPKHLDYFNFTGKIIGRALIEEQNLFDAHLTSSLYKVLLKRPLEIDDLKDIDRELHSSLLKKLNEKTNDKNSNGDDDDGMVFTLGFDDEEEEEEEAEEEEREIQLSSNSNQMYVNSKIDYRLKGSINDQINAFCNGFYSVLSYENIRMFLPNEMEVLISGMPIIDINDLKRNLEFQFPYNKNSPEIKLFLETIAKWSQERLAQLILFITKAPNSCNGGFRAMKELGNPIKIAPADGNKLPLSHPFINTLILPAYEDEDDLNWNFLLAFNQVETKSGNRK